MLASSVQACFQRLTLTGTAGKARQWSPVISWHTEYLCDALIHVFSRVILVRYKMLGEHTDALDVAIYFICSNELDLAVIALVANNYA